MDSLMSDGPMTWHVERGAVGMNNASNVSKVRQRLQGVKSNVGHGEVLVVGCKM